MGVTVTKDTLEAIIKAVSSLTNKSVLVGIPDSAPEHADTPLTSAQIGYIQETGDPARNLPARPFLVPGVQSVQSNCADRLRKGATAAMSGNVAGAEAALTAAGLVAESAVKAKINSNIQPKLADSTLEKRRARGVTRENTLVDTGQMRNAVTHVIRDT
ncbi:hypothetical protein [Robbsia andropogonis]|uniref:hypothetical protein n=1 Tax=Robbsia andropogonis TaxID=28092 RepID=UPI00209F6A37|nr:hypothetical protein [Robbsia andropogonis]MCP1120109.1 hypothetical protein [Robbsia andropogonis]MCP1130059.1 hypothetical protein [Robbsia andropogonis]